MTSTSLNPKTPHTLVLTLSLGLQDHSTNLTRGEPFPRAGVTVENPPTQRALTVLGQYAGVPEGRGCQGSGAGPVILGNSSWGTVLRGLAGVKVEGTLRPHPLAQDRPSLGRWSVSDFYSRCSTEPGHPCLGDSSTGGRGPQLSEWGGSLPALGSIEVLGVQ